MQGGFLQAAEVARSVPFVDGSSHPVNMRIVEAEPRDPQDQWEAGLVQDVELDVLTVVPGRKRGHWRGLVHDGS